jgi:hypothetical protein
MEKDNEIPAEDEQNEKISCLVSPSGMVETPRLQAKFFLRQGP